MRNIPHHTIHGPAKQNLVFLYTPFVSMLEKDDLTRGTHIVHSNNNKQLCDTPIFVLTKEELFFLEIVRVTGDGSIPGFSHFWFSPVRHDKLGWDTEIDDQVTVGELDTFLFEPTSDATNGGRSKVHSLDWSFGIGESRQGRRLFALVHFVIVTWDVRILGYVVLVIIVVVIIEFFGNMTRVRGLGIATGSVVCNVVLVESIVFIVTKRGWGT
jgi:hypothetical protein